MALNGRRQGEVAEGVGWECVCLIAPRKFQEGLGKEEPHPCTLLPPSDLLRLPSVDSRGREREKEGAPGQGRVEEGYMGESRRRAGTPSSVLLAEVDAPAAVVQHGGCWGSEGRVSANHRADCGCCQPIPWGE